MKLLIVTQTVDTEDPVLGFFVRWIEEFAKHVECVAVICLMEGKHDSLPKNVRVHSLGKEKNPPRFARRLLYAIRFKMLAWRLRHDYDAVFVHMNPEYIVVAGPLWRLLGKRVALWYTHKNVDAKLRIAEKLVNIIFTASKESFRLPSKKVHIMGHGIDTDFFSTDSSVVRGTAALSAGRLSPTKRNDLIIRAAEHFPNELRIVGDGPEQDRLERIAKELSIEHRVHFLGPKNQKGLRDEYCKAGVFVHASETGSLDKVVLEALACGLPVVTTAVALADLPVQVVDATPMAIAEGVIANRQANSVSLAAYVREHHSIGRLIPAILQLLVA
ncbi:MAG: glycosyltransferase [Candidatus Paceibacterota bacterium]|jgi:glycosyltransferase involved in cell wall biosynthesis